MNISDYAQGIGNEIIQARTKNNLDEVKRLKKLIAQEYDAQEITDWERMALHHLLTSPIYEQSK